MMDFLNTDESKTHQERIQRYYQFHASFYDISRWLFLFGRKSLTEWIADVSSPTQILEIGCGTGYHLKKMAEQFPSSNITGIDLSDDMLEIARNKTTDSSKITLQNKRYATDHITENHYDAIVLSYSLTMMGVDAETILNQIYNDLAPGGVIAVVDFHTTPVPLFERWMEFNHVDFSGASLHNLKSCFTPLKSRTQKAFWGLWNYYQFIGQK